MAYSNITSQSPSRPRNNLAKAKYPQTRQLTILETVSNPTGSTPRQVGVSYVPVQLEPCVVLRGKWLREAGFSIGEKVTVSVTDGQLVIVPVVSAEVPIP